MTDVSIPDRALSWRFSRSGGPGGQGVNTTDSRVELTCIIAELDTSDETRALIGSRLGEKVTVSSSETRHQLKNRELALARLHAVLLDAAKVTKPRRATKVPASQKAKRLEGKQRRSQLKSARRKVEY